MWSSKCIIVCYFYWPFVYPLNPDPNPMNLLQVGYWRAACQSEIPPNCLIELVGCELHGSSEDLGRRLDWEQVHQAWQTSRTVPQLESETRPMVLDMARPPGMGMGRDCIELLRQSGDFFITGHTSGQSVASHSLPVSLPANAVTKSGRY